MKAALFSCQVCSLGREWMVSVIVPEVHLLWVLALDLTAEARRGSSSEALDTRFTSVVPGKQGGSQQTQSCIVVLLQNNQHAFC